MKAKTKKAAKKVATVKAKSTKGGFDSKKFGEDFQAFLTKKKITWRAAGEKLDITLPTINRVINAYEVRVNTYFGICKLMNVSIAKYEKK